MTPLLQRGMTTLNTVLAGQDPERLVLSPPGACTMPRKVSSAAGTHLVILVCSFVFWTSRCTWVCNMLLVSGSTFGM